MVRSYPQGDVIRVSYLKGEPEVVDEITAERVSIHIERMSDGEYWMRVGDREFSASTLKRGKLIITVRN